MCIAAQDDGYALLAAEAQNLQIVVVGLHQSACRPEAGVVDLQECMRLGGRPYYGFVILRVSFRSWKITEIKTGKQNVVKVTKSTRWIIASTKQIKVS